MECRFSVLTVPLGLRDMSAVEADPPPHDLVIRRLRRRHHSQDIFQDLPPALRQFRIGSFPSVFFLDLPFDVFADPFQVRLPPAIPSSELVFLQRDTSAQVFDFAHEPHRSRRASPDMWGERSCPLGGRASDKLIDRRALHIKTDRAPRRFSV